VWITYSFLLAWVGGGTALLAILVMRTTARPYALTLGLVGYGAAGFVSTGVGLEPRLPLALAGALLGAGLGYGIGRLGRAERGLPLDVR
jgi:hypothetical protein